MADILILANSTKKGGFCVAGKDIETNRWVRIVGSPKGLALNSNQIVYNDLANNRQIIQYEPFNKIIRLDLGDAVPLRYQPENVLIGQKTWQEIHIAKYNITYDTPIDLWGTGDRIKAEDIKHGLVNITQSLYLIQVTNLQFYVNNYNVNRACFQYGNTNYDLGATMNPKIFQDIVNGTRHHNSVLTVSLGDSFLNPHSNQYEHYKLVAAVF
ncbi:MAG: hypothetical protein LBP19_09315 [Treponema sp.]|jgi:hypothetical protein|nr:hypothetical protein [Treponema sp.]